jgi:hypothetical protein
VIAELRSWWQGLRRSVTLGDPALRNFWQSGIWGGGIWGGVQSSAGVTVTERSSLTASAVWAAVQCIAGDVASLPFLHYQRTADGGKARYDTSKLYRVLHDEFNSEMSAMVGRETLTAHALGATATRRFNATK